MAKILVVDDDYELRDTVTQSLTNEGYIVDSAPSAAEAEHMLDGFAYDLIILDWMMPDVTGIDFLRSMRKRGLETPVLMLTGMDTVDDKATGLDTGADDYLTKPFVRKELVARVRAVLRRPKKLEATEITLANITLNSVAQRAKRDSEELKLTRQEFLLLEFLMRNKNIIFSSEALVERAWSSLSESSPDTVRVHMSRLRKKLGEDIDDCPIKTVHGQGYIFVAEEDK